MGRVGMGGEARPGRPRTPGQSDWKTGARPADRPRVSIERTLLTGLAVGLALLLEAPCAHATPSAPQTTVQRHAELGLEFVLPRGYEARPVGGDEAGTLLVFRERSAEGIPSTLRFHQVDPEDAGTDDLGELVRVAYAGAGTVDA